MTLFEGRIVRLLSDDTFGDRHQRFVIELASGQTLLVAHNIDIGHRIDGLYLGARVTVYGEFEPNDLGGVVHWTHLDPDTDHENGWILFKGVRYD